MLLRHASRTTRSLRGGFTLLEILIVVAIIVLLASVSITVAYNYYENSQVNVAKTKTKALAGACTSYYTDQQAWPSSLQDITRAQGGYKPYAAPDDIKDPWGHEYQMVITDDGVTISTTHNGQTISNR